MDRSVKKQRHEQDRKRHKQEAERHARELAKQPRANIALWLFGGVLVLVGAIVAAALVAR